MILLKHCFRTVLAEIRFFRSCVRQRSRLIVVAVVPFKFSSIKLLYPSIGTAEAYAAYLFRSYSGSLSPSWLIYHIRSVGVQGGLALIQLFSSYTLQDFYDS